MFEIKQPRSRKAVSRKTTFGKTHNGDSSPAEAPPAAAPARRQILAVARENLSFSSLRPGQEDAIRSLVAGKDSLVVMPTGAGKSAIYQIAGLMINGVVLVVSPLIALQKDQVDSINSQLPPGSPEAVAVNSCQAAAETREAFAKIERGDGKFVFLAPEQLHKPETIAALQSAGITLIVIDEAHCISEWGHDFRPDYLQLGSVVERLGHPVVLAMTATAAPKVREEIAERLCMRNPETFVHGFDRPNISLRVDHFDTADAKLEELVHRVSWALKPGIVYVGSRKAVDTIVGLLKEADVNALGYHAGLKASLRNDIQDRFMSGDAEVIVATNAFGMGIDKANIRFVYHYDIPDSLDSYYQEIGRAGRDDEPSEAVLFFRGQDLSVAAFKSGEARLAASIASRVADAIAQAPAPISPAELAASLDLSKHKLANILHRLEDAGAVEVDESCNLRIIPGADLEQASRTAAEQQDLRREMKRERLSCMREYADTTGCRREHLLRYFGGDFAGPCGNCDRCQAESAPANNAHAAAAGVEVPGGTRREVA